MNNQSATAAVVAVVVVVIVLMIPAIVNASSTTHHHSVKKCLPPYSVLYVYTQPVQKECVLLMHNGVAVNASTGAPFSSK